MTSPLSRISTGSFFSGVILEYSSLGCPGTTAAGVNSILSIRPVSIAAMRTFRANGEAGEKVSFILLFLRCFRRHCGEAKQSKVSERAEGWIASSLSLLAMTAVDTGAELRRDDFLALL